MNLPSLNQTARIVLTLLLLTAVLACRNGEQAAPRSAANRYIVATDPTLAPMTFLNERNELIGFEADLIREVARAAGFEIDFALVEFPGLFGGLITRKFDMVISSITILDERKKRMAFSRPYLRSGLALLARRDDARIRSIADLESQHLLAGAQTGSTSYFFLQQHPDIRVSGYQHFGHAVADLIKGDLDAVIGESTGTLYLKNQKKDVFQKIKMAGEILTEEYYGIVLRPEDAELLQRVDAALGRLLRDGTVQGLHAKWDLGQAAFVPPA